jgi:cytochrome c peroxidase
MMKPRRQGTSAGPKAARFLRGSRGALGLAVFLLLALAGCRKDPPPEGYGNWVLEPDIPLGFPDPVIPADNQLTANRVALGKRLFNDPILSRDFTISCGSCHFEEQKFTDGLPVSVGIEGRKVTRNAMSLLNAAYQPNMFWDGGVPNLEQQVLAPIENVNEMDFDVNKVVERLQNHPEYPALFKQAYGAGPSVYTLTRAIACFERSLYTSPSRFDLYQYGIDPDALDASEINGMNLFFGEKGDCFHCHGGYNFTDFSFQNNGLYLQYADSGRARITADPDDVGKFKVPSLRNVALTAPYMHDGSMKTLGQVIDHYDSGGKQHPNQSGIVKVLNLTPQEKQDLINFLKALTDHQ